MDVQKKQLVLLTDANENDELAPDACQIESIPVEPCISTQPENNENDNTKSTYDAAKIMRASNWAALDTIMHDIYLEGLIQKHACHTCDDEAHIMCCDCTYGTMFCSACFMKYHENLPFHLPVIWQDHCYVQGSVARNPLKRKDGHECFSSYCREMIVYDDKGREHNMGIMFCDCEKEAATLVRHRLWPGSPIKSNMVFSFGLLELIRYWRIECQSSLFSICETLKQLHKLGSFTQQDNDFYGTLILESFQQYVSFTSKLNASHLLENDMMCPACPKNAESPIIVAADACFGLVRKLSSGKQISNARYGTNFFVDQDSVNTFVKQHETKVNKVNAADCNDFQASSLLKGGDHKKKLDEKAVFGAVCRHDFPLYFYNIKHDGEKIGYVVFMLEKLKEKFGEQRIVFMYDIACQLHSHLKNSEKRHLLNNTTLTVPAFHAYGHTSKCQSDFASRLTVGTGLADGENMERLWSFLRKFSNITKMMTPNNRIDVLNEALNHYWSKSVGNLGKKLVQRIKRAQSVLEDAEKQISDICGISNDEINVEALRAKYLLGKPKIHSEKDKFTRKKDTYIMKLSKYYELRQKIQNESEPDENEQSEKFALRKFLKAVENREKFPRPKKNSRTFIKRLKKETRFQRMETAEKLRHIAAESKHLLHLIGHARGQAVYKKINATLLGTQKKLKKTITHYNNIPQSQLSLEDPPLQLTIEEVKEQKLPFWRTLNNNEGPTNLEMKVVDIIAKRDRSKEEIVFVKNDMVNHFQYLLTQYGKLEKGINECDNKSAIIIKQAAYLELETTQIFQMYNPYVSLQNTTPLNYSNMLGLCNRKKLDDYIDSVECESDNEDINV